jgi:hypothetical protein
MNQVHHLMLLGLSLGHDCEMAAPSLIAKKAGVWAKTNWREAVELAKLSRSGEFTAVWIPDDGVCQRLVCVDHSRDRFAHPAVHRVRRSRRRPIKAGALH